MINHKEKTIELLLTSIHSSNFFGLKMEFHPADLDIKDVTIIRLFLKNKNYALTFIDAKTLQNLKLMGGGILEPLDDLSLSAISDAYDFVISDSTHQDEFSYISREYFLNLDR